MKFALVEVKSSVKCPYKKKNCQWIPISFGSVQMLSRIWLSANPWTAALQPPCPSPTPGVYANSCPLSWWYHPTISSSVVPLSSRLKSFPESGSFQMSQFFASGGQSTGVSASAPVLPMNIHDWFPLGLAGLISLQSKGLWKSFLQHHSSKGLTLRCCFLYGPTLTSMHDYWKNHSFD